MQSKTTISSLFLTFIFTSVLMMSNAQDMEPRNAVPAEPKYHPDAIELKGSQSGTYEVEITVQVDSYHNEATWNVWDISNEEYYFAEDQTFGGSNEENTEILSLSIGCFEVHCWDSWGDGGISGAVELGENILVEWGENDYQDNGFFEFSTYPGPYNLTTTIIDENNVQLDWEIPVYEDTLIPTGYKIFRNEQAIDSVIDTSYLDESLNFSVYEYYITAFNNENNLESSPSNYVTTPVIGEAVFIPDTNFRKVINEHLDYDYPESINHHPTEEELASIYNLNGKNRSIEDIIGAEYLDNIDTLNLADNDLTEINSISGLYTLTALYLSDNSITDIIALSALNELSTLTLDHNSLSDISQLSGIYNLTFLDLSFNSITNVNPLSDLTNLESLNLSVNSISNITPVSGLYNLKSFYLYVNSVTDITALSSLTALEMLHLSSNNIMDITPLSSLSNLSTLDLSYNSVNDLEPLSGLSNLTSLNLKWNNFTDISSISDLAGLEVLSLGGNTIADYTPLSELINLENLLLKGNSLKNISFITSLTELKYVVLMDNSLTDIGSLSDLPNLSRLYINNNSISDIYPLIQNMNFGDNSEDILWIQDNPISKEALQKHIPILSERSFNQMLYDSTFHTNAPCYPAPGRDQDTVIEALSWEANYDSLENVTYDLHYGNSLDEMTIYQQGLTETYSTIEPETGQEYYWRVEAVHDGDTLYGGVWNFTNESAHYTPIWEGNVYQPMTFMISGASLDGLQLEADDEIGIFDGNTCVGAGVLNHSLDTGNPQDYLEITTSKDGGEGDGFTEGNPITYKIWDSSEETEAIVTNVSFPYEPDYMFEIFTELETNFVLLEAQTTIAQQIYYQAGWNMTSFAVEPENKNMQTILQPLIDNDHLLKVIDEQGNIIEEMPWGWVNNIGAMSLTEGYYLKLSADDSISVEGELANLPYDIPLTNGWNMIGYPAMDAQNASDVFASLMSNNTLIKVIDEQGNIIEEMPWGWVDNIGNMQAGEGYYVKVSSDATLTIEEPAGNGLELKPKYQSPLANHFTPVYQGNPYEPMQMVIDASSLNLKQGDELAIFSNGQCVGAAGYNPGRDYQYLTASKDESQTAGQDGYLEGTPVALKVYRKAANTVCHVPYESIEGPTGYEPLQTKIVRATKLTTGMDDEQAQSVILYQNKPNPFKDMTTISYHLPERGEVELSVYNIHGQKITTLVKRLQSQGEYSMKFNKNVVEPGVYIYRLRFEPQLNQSIEVLHRKMTVIR